jgi:hypothetical protein
MFENLKTSTEIQDEKDVLGGGRTLFDTDVYKGVITMAYGKKSDGGAMALALTVKFDDGREFSKDVYMSNKKGENFYIDKDGEKHYLPGFNLINSLCLLTTGVEVSQSPHEKKMVKVYNFDSKADVPTEVPVLVDLIGKEAMFAIEKITDDKKTKVGDDYVATGETVEVNDIVKIFCTRDGFEGMTQTEIKAARGGNKPEVLYKDQWLEKNKGKVRNKAKGAAAGGNTGAPSAAGAGAAKKPTNSLFG